MRPSPSLVLAAALSWFLAAAPLAAVSVLPIVFYTASGALYAADFENAVCTTSFDGLNWNTFSMTAPPVVADRFYSNAVSWTTGGVFVTSDGFVYSSDSCSMWNVVGWINGGGASRYGVGLSNGWLSNSAEPSSPTPVLVMGGGSWDQAFDQCSYEAWVSPNAANWSRLPQLPGLGGGCEPLVVSSPSSPGLFSLDGAGGVYLLRSLDSTVWQHVSSSHGAGYSTRFAAVSVTAQTLGWQAALAAARRAAAAAHGAHIMSGEVLLLGDDSTSGCTGGAGHASCARPADADVEAQAAGPAFATRRLRVPPAADAARKQSQESRSRAKGRLSAVPAAVRDASAVVVRSPVLTVSDLPVAVAEPPAVAAAGLNVTDLVWFSAFGSPFLPSSYITFSVDLSDWEPVVQPAPFPPRYGGTMLTFNGALWFCGGFTEPGRLGQAPEMWQAQPMAQFAGGPSEVPWPSRTVAPSVSSSRSGTASATVSQTDTCSATISATHTSTSSISATYTATQTSTWTPSSTLTASATGSATPTARPSSCPVGYYGTTCSACPGVLSGHPSCFGNGVCDGDGIALGTGKCSCYSGWIGDECNLSQVGLGSGISVSVIALALGFVWYRRGGCDACVHRCGSGPPGFGGFRRSHTRAGSAAGAPFVDEHADRKSVV